MISLHEPLTRTSTLLDAMTTTITSINREAFPYNGGYLLQLNGTFDVVPYNVHVGTTGNATDPVCYAGQGLGTSITPISTSLIECWLPEMTLGELVKVFAVQEGTPADNDTLDEAFAVIERNYSSKLLSMKSLIAPNLAAGFRSMQNLPPVDYVKNLLIQSADLTKAIWIKSESYASSGEDDPFGGTDAFVLGDNTANEAHLVEQAVSMTSGVLYVASAYARENEVNWFGIGAGAHRQAFNLATGEIGTAAQGTHKAFILPSVDVGGQWYRVGMVWVQASTASQDFELMILSGDTFGKFVGTGWDSLVVAFPQLDVYPLPRAYRETVSEAIT